MKQQQAYAPRAQASKHAGGVPKKAQLNYVSTDEATSDDGVIVGKLSINSISTRVLFDS
jgi:hypothetical protein